MTAEPRPSNPIPSRLLAGAAALVVLAVMAVAALQLLGGSGGPAASGPTAGSPGANGQIARGSTEPSAPGSSAATSPIESASPSDGTEASPGVLTSPSPSSSSGGLLAFRHVYVVVMENEEVDVDRRAPRCPVHQQAHRAVWPRDELHRRRPSLSTELHRALQWIDPWGRRQRVAHPVGDQPRRPDRGQRPRLEGLCREPARGPLLHWWFQLGWPGRPRHVRAQAQPGDQLRQHQRRPGALREDPELQPNSTRRQPITS